MGRKPEIGNVQLYPKRKLTSRDTRGFYLQFYCPLKGVRVRRLCSTRNRRKARQIQRECQRRLIDGRYVASMGAITDSDEQLSAARVKISVAIDESTLGWSEALDRYLTKLKKRNRRKSIEDATSRLGIVERVLKQQMNVADDSELPLSLCMKIEVFDELEIGLLEGKESIKSERSPNTVNGIMRTVMAFTRFCRDRKWIKEVPRWKKISVDDVMKLSLIHI